MKYTEIPLENKHKFDYWGIPIGILFFLSFIALGLLLAIHFRPLYYLNIGWMNLEASSGFSEAVIRENYDALIDYCSPFYTGNLVFPSMQASVSGLSHFDEVKSIFNFIYVTGLVSMVLAAAAVYFKARRKEFQYLVTSSITAAGIPVLLAIISAINYNAVFNLFHKIVFSNDDWIFDEVTDPIIRILPESYFMQCTFIIIGVTLLGSLTLFLFYWFKKKSQPEHYLLPRKKNYYY